MNFKKILFIVLFAAFIQGCAVQKILVPTGGSRSDGTVKMSYDLGALQVATVDQAQGMKSAKSRCAAWGYTGAEPFGGETRTCTSSSMGSCNMFHVTIEYQCTGTLPSMKM